MRFLAGKSDSSPPLKKKVTGAYFSVSGDAELLQPGLSAICPSVYAHLLRRGTGGASAWRGALDYSDQCRGRAELRRACAEIP